MAIRILWDEEEAAILLDALIQTLEGKMSRDEAVSSVSYELREKAKRKGIKIDDIFRNENGIKLQMLTMEYIYTDGKSGLDKGKMRVFRNVVDMYKNNHDSYETLLKEAKQKMGRSKSVQDEFFTWLATKVSATQLSDFYMLYGDIESFCYTRKIIHQKLFETRSLSEIRDVVDTVNLDKVFRRTYKKSTQKMSIAIKYYYDFMKEYLEVNENTKIEREKKSFDRNIPQRKMVLEQVGRKNTIELAKKSACDSEEFSIDFYKENLIAYTEPVSISYFGKKYSAYYSWNWVYVKVVSCLQEDHPEVFKTLLGKNILKRGSRIDIGNSEEQYRMRAPKKIAESLYLETYYGSIDIIKRIQRLLDICNVEYENLIITYRKKIIDSKRIEKNAFGENEIEENKESQEKNIHEMQTGINRTERSRFMEWLKETNTDIGRILGYTMDVKKCSEFAKEKKIITEDLFDIKNVAILQNIDNQLFKEPDVRVYVVKHGGSLQESFRKFIEFRKAMNGQNLKYENTVIDSGKTLGMIKQRFYEKNIESENRYNTILIKYFEEDGYQLGRAIFRGRFKRFYNTEFGSDMPDSDENMEIILQKIGTVRDGRVFPKQDVEQNSLIEDIVNDIVVTLNEGASAVYIEAVYDKYQQQLANSLQIYHMDALTPILVDNAKGRYIRRHSYLVKNGKSAETERDVLRVLKASHQPLNYEEIHKKLWYIPYDKMKHCLVVDKSIVNVAQETYFYAPNLPIDAGELNELISLIQMELDYRMYITDVELMELIQTKLPTISVDTEGFTIYGLRNCLGYILRDHFAFKGPIISAIGSEISMNDVYAEYARQHETFSLIELKELAKEMKTTIYWDAVMNEQVRISETEFVRRDLIDFDVEAIDNLLDEMCAGAYIAIKDISLFLYFPAIGYQWNSYILESYLFRESRKFKLLHASFAQTDVYGAMVRSDSEFEEYQELIVDVLSKSSALGNRNAALQYIVDKGFQQRLRLTGIEQIIEKARLIKEKREKEEK